jgi:hypothetical protein
MSKIAQLQVAAMTPDAQRAAVRRLALTGLDDIEIAKRTGWTSGQVRAALAPPGAERFFGRLERRIQLPSPIHEESVSASFRDGSTECRDGESDRSAPAADYGGRITSQTRKRRFG